MKRVSVLGIGWLGNQLAGVLKENNFKVVGTVSSKAKAKTLAKQIDSVEKFNILDFQKTTTKALKFKTADHFVVTIPPSAAEKYGEIICELIEELLLINPHSKLVFLSSISVYGDEDRFVSELSSIAPKIKNAIKLAHVEDFLLNNYPNRSFILRLGGLMGESRHPINFLSGRKSLSKPFAAVNLIHSHDICRLITKLLTLENNFGIFNLCCEDHPSKQDYYSWAAAKLGIEKPHYNTVDNQKDKVVICDAIKKINFELKYKSPYDFNFTK